MTSQKQRAVAVRGVELERFELKLKVRSTSSDTVVRRCNSRCDHSISVHSDARCLTQSQDEAEID